MKFGRSEDISGVDFSLPAPPSQNSETLQNVVQHNKKEIFIGCPVWADKSYVGKVYPKHAKAKDYLFHYAKQFNCIELNATHYTIPSSSTVRNWISQTPEGFKFCPKFTNSISHASDYGQQGHALEHFMEAIYGFGNRLGMSFIQFPPYFAINRLESLYRFLKSLPSDMEVAVELRHPSWFSGDSTKTELFDMLQSLSITAVITDSPGRRDVLHQYLSSDTTFIRFLGHELHPTDYTRIEAWCTQLNFWLESGLNKVYFFVHQPEKHFCADLIAYMVRLMNRKFGHQLKAPKILIKDPQTNLFD